MPDVIRRNLNKTLKNVFFLPRIFGLFPLKLGARGFFVCPIMLTVSTCFAICISVWTVSNVVLITLYLSLPLIHFLSVMVRTIFVVFIGACIVTSLRSVRKMNHIFDDLWCIDNFLFMFGSTVKDSVPMYFGVICIVSHIILFFVQKLYTKVPIELANIYLSFVITHAAECQYIGMLSIFLTRYRALNHCLKKLRFDKERSSDDAVVLSNVHLLLSESLSDTSRLYSLPLLLFSAISLARFIVFLFTMVILQPNREHGLFVLHYVAFPFWLLLSFLMFFRVIRMIVNVTREADEFNTLLYQMMLEDKNNELLNNPKLYLHIAMKKEVVFTACGFFRLDYTLVHSMIAATTTYLVILIQFGQMKPPTLIPTLPPSNTTQLFNTTLSLTT